MSDDIFERDIIADAERAAESLRYLGRSTLAEGDNDDFQGDVDLLMDVVNAMKAARRFHAGLAGGQRYHAVRDVRHVCGTVLTAEAEPQASLYDLVLMARRHECAPEPEKLSEVDEARTRLQRAYRKAVGINIFDTDTGAVMDAALGLVHTVVKAERDRVAETYTNSGAERMDDLDALDRLVEMTEPGKLRVG